MNSLFPSLPATLRVTTSPATLTILFVENLEGFNEPVSDALDDAHSSLGLVLESPERERHRAELLGRLAEELPGVFHLQHVRLVRLLVDGDLRVALTALAFAGRDEDVDGEDFVQLEVVLLVLLPLGLRRVLNDSLLTVDAVLLKLEKRRKTKLGASRIKSKSYLAKVMGPSVQTCQLLSPIYETIEAWLEKSSAAQEPQ